MIATCPLVPPSIWQWHPPVGTWIGILASLGVVVPLLRPLEKIGSREKVVWTLVMFALLGLEVRTLYRDRDELEKEHAHTECEETEQFRSIAAGLSTAISTEEKQFTATMAKSEVNAKLARKSIDLVSGGTSFCYLADVQPGFHGSPGVGLFRMIGNGPLFGVEGTLARFEGEGQASESKLIVPNFPAKHPLHALGRMEMSNMPRGTSSMEEFEFNSKQVPKMLDLDPIPGSNGLVLTIDAEIDFDGRNGSWIQVLHTVMKRKTKDDLSFYYEAQETYVIRDKKVIYSKGMEKFPKGYHWRTPVPAALR